MRKILMLILVLVLLLTGCQGNSSKTTEVNQSTTTIASESTSQVESTTETTESEVPVTFTTRNPEPADISFLARKVTAIDKEKEPYPDFRLADLTALDLTNEIEYLKWSAFSTTTKWPDKLPTGFDPVVVMEIGENPGLGVRSLQEQGITGKGVNIAIIDSGLLLEHEEYSNQIKSYEETNMLYSQIELHGAFVSSLSVGKSSGVAPDAGLYYIGCNNFDGDYTHINFIPIANGIDRVLEYNESLPDAEKIRVISISSNTCPEQKGYTEYIEAIERAKQANVFVITCNLFDTYGFWTYALDKEFLTDPDDTASYTPFSWDFWLRMVSHMQGVPEYYQTKFDEEFQGEMLLVPTGSRTFALPTGTDQYSFERFGGWSAMEPYLAGVYAMACQVKPDITPEIFWAAALSTGDPDEITDGNNVNHPAKILNPVKLIESLQN